MNLHRRIHRASAIVVLIVALLLIQAATAPGCPFCAAASQTLSEETQGADVVVLGKLVKEASTDEAPDKGRGAGSNSGTATFQVTEVIRGDASLVKSGQEIDVVYFGPADKEQLFMVTGIGSDKIDWVTPLPLSAAAVDYMRQLPKVAASGAERLAFFQEYLEHSDPLLAQDAFDEFSRAQYTDLHDLKPRMHHERLVKWILDPEISPSRRRLYFTMLGVCGGESDLPMLEELIVSDYSVKQPFVEQLVSTGLSLGGPIGLPAWAELARLDERRKKLGLDAMVACYLTLRGGDGLDLIDKQFLKNPATEYSHIYSTVMALRFHGDEPTSQVPKDRLQASMRLLLDNADFADQVPIDLSRWKDWSVLDRLVEMFKTADKNGYIRQPVVTYLTEAAKEPGDVGVRAKAALVELEKLDPEGVKQAQSLAAFGALARARANSPAASTEADTASKNASPTAAGDASQGFAASAADVSESTPGEIPDPTEYDGSESNTPAVDEAKSPTAEQPASVAVAPVALQTNPGVAAHRPLVIGVPLVAAVVLMGVYWVILRFGAV